MEGIIVYGSHHCKKCTRMHEYFKKNDIKYTYYDISLDFQALKRFLKIRDINSEYDDIKKEERVGLPTILLDKKLIVGFDEQVILKLEELFD